MEHVLVFLRPQRRKNQSSVLFPPVIYYSIMSDARDSIGDFGSSAFVESNYEYPNQDQVKFPTISIHMQRVIQKNIVIFLTVLPSAGTGSQYLLR